MRGLKPVSQKPVHHVTEVASYMGAWIETSKSIHYFNDFTVASYMGAWIETINAISINGTGMVASYMGAWIETAISSSDMPDVSSRILHGCVD